MKKALVLLLSFVAMVAASTGLRAQEVTIQLAPGWNWIGYPYPETASLETVFGDFEPLPGDRIESIIEISEYMDGTGWFGEIEELQPGWGYLYYSNRTETVSVVLSAPASPSMVVTTEPTDITTTSAVVGGMVILPVGGHLFLRGVCWGTTPNPDIDGSRISEGTSTGSFSGTLVGLSPNTLYYVRAYAVTDHGLTYGEELSFTTVQIPNYTISVSSNPTEGGTVSGGGSYQEDTSCTLTATANEGYTFTNWTEAGEEVSTDVSYTFTVNEDRDLVANFAVSSSDHDYVDLGLPSGTLWATCNVGADNPEDYGDYFAWGETQPKDTYNWNYQYCNGSGTTFTKYCNNSSYGYNGFTDTLTTLLPEDDAATANWGGDWRMPTKEEFEELCNNTTVTWTTQNGVNGRLFTASNGNSLFLPAAGIRDNSWPFFAGSEGYYWSSSLNTDGPDPEDTWLLYFDGANYGICCYSRIYGRSVRPVRVGSQNTAPTGAINGKFTINEDGDQVYFSQGNLQYIGSAATPYWKFAENQWDCLGTTTGQNSSNQNVDRDLFGWGTSGWNPGNTCYQPWDTYNSTGSSYGPIGANNLAGTYANADWGVNNPISNGGNESGQWRTLIKDEWGYVFDSRETATGIRFAKANVNDVNGVILLPDDWNTSYYSLNDTNTNDTSYSSNIITDSEWDILEEHGAVFIPANGYRFGTSVSYVGSRGYYWSSSYVNGTYAYGVYILDSNLNPQDCSNRSYGRGVRLVHAVE